ncbi:hypothetical protein [Diaphorobacter sp. LR2014-1]|uniref:hypothetical protein n=1 Tax=Diaphorobacter sp. LR2014-1 TaxID=1933219 RepID=UPI000CDAD473|nr:hypothetical protein [Diaphorobacter sp. LR2014-1]POR07976.1 hypothetical protein BV908_18515 [Diaphorobacter sp. LR2014-1]
MSSKRVHLATETGGRSRCRYTSRPSIQALFVPMDRFLLTPVAQRCQDCQAKLNKPRHNERISMEATQHLQAHAESAVRATQWFRTAPHAVKASLKVEVLGVEVRPGRSMMDGEVSGPCLVAEAICGEETRRFSWAFRFGDTNEIV